MNDCNCCDASECCDKLPEALDKIERLTAELRSMSISYMKARTEIHDMRQGLATSASATTHG